MKTAHDFSSKHLLRDLLDFVYPPVCQVCRKTFEREGDNIWLCTDCHSSLAILPQPHCAICRSLLSDPGGQCSNCRRPSPIRWVYSLGIYDDHFSHLIKAFKYEGKVGLGKKLGDMLGDQLARLPHSENLDIICAVPIHHKKERLRGFNQTEILAKRVAAGLGLTFQPKRLVQTKLNSDQIGLTVEERYRNVTGIFSAVDAASIRAKHVLLVDDVTTSGATLNSAALTLLSAGAASVAAATIAMALEEGLEPSALYALMSDEF